MRVFLAALLLLLAGCGDNDSESGFETPEKDEHGRYVITMQSDRSFSPDKATVPKESAVVFKAELDGCRIQSDPASGPDSKRPGPGTTTNTGLVNKGDSYVWLAPSEAAEFKVSCAAYSQMTMTLRVG